ncbi:MAG: DUF1553 domain-containing protein [Verrucomicrobia bacterium]|nr:MAG: DUF1553 domain-containing protein [Verrucomicrobiota bacterium]
MRLFSFVVIFLGGLLTAGGKVEYNREVLPILTAKCLACHGPDASQQKADLRLDDPAEAYRERDGLRVVVPGDPDQSELVHRIFSKDDDEVMPPPGEGTALTDAEKEILQKWISEGAQYERHWAFRSPVKSRLPDLKGGKEQVIDAFVQETLSQVGFELQEEAAKEELIRRVSIDLTGLPPSIEEVDAFIGDQSPEAYGRVVNRLLASPRYGERMAAWWLDGARYGDSHGYDNDLENAQWPWRNWIIESFNANQPYDQFVTWQLAGDLMPDASDDQIVATGFNRNHRIQTEGGAIEEEWRTEYVMDRVETMGSVFLGLTLSCARCHDHKYDPISQKEFYQLFAMFDGLNEKGFINNLRGSAEPRHRYRKSDFEAAVKKLETDIPDAKDRSGRVKDLEAAHPHVMVMRDEVDRKAFILKRGHYDDKGEEVDPGLPEAFSPVPEGESLTRLDLARWLVDGEHPLTSRVFVNRIWEQFFGTGIVKSSENLGRQSDWPSHPQLLDWIAVDFVESGWDVKGLIRAIVMSRSYRQSSIIDEERLQRDPENRLLSRGPRTRLQAEMLRDQALFLSGLLVERIGGPSWWVYQPAGLWLEVEKRGTFVQDHGEKLYRRSLYSRIRRTVAPPSMLLFDMPSREMCSVKRTLTNTPLQALALLNEVTYVEAAKKFAERMMTKGGTPGERIAWGFRCATSRVAEKGELEILVKGYERRVERYRRDGKAAEDLLGQGESKVADYLPKPEMAALTTVANVILNLDEVINR